MIPKFRAYDGSTNRMYEPEEVLVGNENIYIDDEDFEDWTQNNDLLLMQSTGLFDKNGVEIFEGDVVKFEDSDEFLEVFVNRGVIEWSQGSFSISDRISIQMDDLLDGQRLDVEVIGNVWEDGGLIDSENRTRNCI